MSGFQEASEKMQEASPAAADANGTETAAAPAQAPEPEPEPAAAAAAAAAATGAATAEGGEKKLSKNAMKKLAKSGGKKKEKKKFAPPAATSEKKKEKKKAAEVIVTYDGPRDGTKKDVSGDMPATYQPLYVEAAWQEYWEAAGFYTCDPAKAASMPADKKFIMVIPPPNVTGSLHLGHALTAAVEDTLCRWHRMLGHATLYVPGTDHAGIATQSVVEKKLKKDENVTRHDLGREEFVNRVWKWKDEYGGKITTQIRKLGSSVDWSREAFTMDANLSRAVTEAFCRFHESGLIYRDTRLGNWSCALKSAISDIEVDYVDLEGKTYMAVPGHTKKPKYEFGTMTHFAYRVEGGEEGEELVVATTRLETMLGDTGVAVHPKDERYKKFHGKTLVHPFTDRKIPVVLDDVLVDMELGTGAVKITPAHDPNDYLCGKRHNLPFITVLGLDGAMNAQAGEFEGMMRYDARVEVEKALESKGLLRGKDPHKMRLGVCSRSGDIIEPMITPQWYVKCDRMAKRAVDAVKNKELRIEPPMHEKTWYQWLDNSRDWCISRQLWWGHRIPAYFASVEGEKAVDQVCLSQDEDVLDTWFSSGLFPFSVFGWPDVDSEDLKAFFPTTLLETGMDILFFWVARMVMMSLELTDVLPFKTVYLHAMVRDKFGRKMSKTLGNVIDPLEVIYGCDLDTLHKKLEVGNLPAKEMQKAKEGQKMDFPKGIPECGADALRFGLLAYTVQGRDVNLDISRVVGYRNFCNKLWNAVRFALTYLTDASPPLDLASELIASLDSAAPRDRWILSRLNVAVAECNRCLEEYKFGDATQVAYSFWLYDLCDYYLELIKPVVGDTSEGNKKARSIAQSCLYLCLDYGLKLIHPIMPFVTEELWQRLPGRGSMGPEEAPSIMVAPYPQADERFANPAAETDMSAVKAAIHAGRSLRSSYGIVPSAKAEFYVKSSSEERHNVITKQASDFITLAKASTAVPIMNEEPPEGCAVHIIDDQSQVYVQLRGMVDFDVEIKKLQKQLDTKIEPQITMLVKKMEAPGYVNKVPEAVRETNSKKKAEFEAQKDSVLKAMQQFEGLKI
ncbi:Valine--tRNA ligase [Ectocarpus siliculosus]|uniref:valine--tRNA ligase n=1 Tax=Ectocarpus siliculosus TaxID=2880 RepID=D8LT18_ECTSI|nr:Valine--tRNA ligase [Ectocarpus siliculosus]|eukprot:CBN75348.1 Valine--tRNA ligase [Ectocarpus siliculosus]